jgi:RloB-like protein
MTRQKRIPATTVLIACEGSVTEATYFERLKEEIEDDGRWAVTVYPDRDSPDDKNAKTSAYQLVELAKSRSGDFDVVWVVFDKDGYSKHFEAFELAKSGKFGKPLNIAFSSIAFEHWILAHFERNVSPFLKSECRDGKDSIRCGTDVHDADCSGDRCICGRLRKKNYLPDYGKNADYDLFPKIRSRVATAIANAAWLKFKHANNSAPIYELNPYTDVDVLVKVLLDIDEQILWSGMEQAVRIHDLEFQLTSKLDTFYLTIQNLGIAAIVLNQIQFTQLDSTGGRHALDFANDLILPGKEHVLKLLFLSDQGLTFQASYKQTLLNFEHKADS